MKKQNEKSKIILIHIMILEFGNLRIESDMIG